MKSDAHAVYDAETMSGVFVIDEMGPRRETRQERQQREQREAVDAQKREVARLRDRALNLRLKADDHDATVRSAKEATETHTVLAKSTRERLAKTKRELAHAEERLAKMERAAA